jgi:Ca2+-binding EF-hand superfamily protein
MKKWVMITAGAALLVTSAVYAAEPYLPRQIGGFNRVDTNRDGKIVQAEFGQVAQKGFARMDVNSDHQVTADEIDKTMMLAIAKRRDRIMKFMDRDGNGTITSAELDNLAEAMFNGADTDRDGSLTLAEAQGFKRGPWRKSLMGQGAN